MRICFIAPRYPTRHPRGGASVYAQLIQGDGGAVTSVYRSLQIYQVGGRCLESVSGVPPHQSLAFLTALPQGRGICALDRLSRLVLSFRTIVLKQLC